MPTIVGILTFMSRTNFMLSQVEHGKSFITSGLDMATVNIVKYSDLLRYFLNAPRMYILIESTENDHLWGYLTLRAVA